MAERWLMAATPPPVSGTRSSPYPYEGASHMVTGATSLRAHGHIRSGSLPQSFDTSRPGADTSASLALVSWDADGPLRPAGDRGQVAGRMGARRRFRRPEPVSRGRAAGAHLRARDAPVPLRRAPHGARAQLHARRRRRAHSPPAGFHRAAPDRVRRLRAAGRERSHSRGTPPARRHEPQHRRDPRADEAARLVDRLEPRALDRRARLLPLDAVALPQVLPAGARLP